jgi:hypothetical protein
MLLLLRRLKHDAFMKDSTRKYALYAIGELLLVIVGILVALQIDNWNEERKEQEALESYLESIARNMEEDLEALGRLEALRFDVRTAADDFALMLGRDRYTVEELTFLNRFRTLAGQEAYFNSNSSAFEALKVSGVLGRLQGSPFAPLIADYYAIAEQLSRLESSLHATTRQLALELELNRPEGLAAWEISMPAAIYPDRLEALQPAFARYVNSPRVEAMANIHLASHELFLYYRSLQALGETIIRAAGQNPSPDSIESPATPLQEWRDGLGQADIITAGRTAYGAYERRAVSARDQEFVSAFRWNSLRIEDGALHVQYPGGAAWASVFWMSQQTRETRNHLDLSRFSHLVIELKGDRGGEEVSVLVKDDQYPDDLAPVAVDLTLTNDWQTYEVELARFAPNDPGRLNTVLGILIFPAEEPLSFSIRNARYR